MMKKMKYLIITLIMTLFIITFLIINQLTGLLVDNKQVPLGMGLDYYHQVDIISKDFNVVVYQYNAGVANP